MNHIEGKEPSFQMGQNVTIIGPNILSDTYSTGVTMEITMLWAHKDGMLYSDDKFPWYPASSLRLVEEELKIGDWVEITGKPDGYPQNWDNEGKIDQVREIKSEGRFWLDKTCLLYRTKCLRKLTPEEIAMHPVNNIGEFTATLKLDTSEFEAQLDKVADKMWKLLVDERLDAIEKRLKEDRNLMTEIEERMDGRVDEIEEDLGKIFKQLAKIDKVEEEIYLDEVADFPPKGKSFSEASQDLQARMVKAEHMLKTARSCKPIMPVRILMVTSDGWQHTTIEATKEDAIAWCERVLDGMMNEECCK